jgi:purine-binding chemotaxis protein CheW
MSQTPPAPQRVAAILEERARLLARPPAAEVPQSELLELLVFALSGQICAVETRAVREVARFTDFSPVPGAPASLFGVTNLHGEILPVFDLRPLLGIAPTSVTNLSRLLVLGEEREELGLLADEVQEVRSMRQDEVLEAPEALAATAGAVLLGVTRDAVIVLDGAQLLRDPRLFVRNQVAEFTPARREVE